MQSQQLYFSYALTLKLHIDWFRWTQLLKPLPAKGNNHRGIPSRLQEAVTIVLGFSEQHYTHSYQQLNHVE